MKNYGKVKVTERTAVGRDDSGKTKMYVVKNYESNEGDVAVMTEIEKNDNVEYNGITVLGYITIIHPYILWGGWGENIIDFKRLAKNELLASGDFVENKYGTMFEK